MTIFEEGPARPRRTHEIGQDLSLLSAGELDERIAQLRAEIARLEIERAAKDRSKSAAEALFRGR
jgi:uncharacterized small protein (DUF1192 family)